jgi:two-component system, cell cycle response regulator CtrA
MRVLLIEDDTVTSQSIQLVLRCANLYVHATKFGEEGLQLCKYHAYDIILLDLDLPDMMGFEVLKALRIANVAIPVLILSGAAGTEEKVNGLKLGADDYMTKPYHNDELLARIRAVVRRSAEKISLVITTGDLTVNLEQKTAEIAGKCLGLTVKEFQILEFLSLRRGTTLTKEMVLNYLYGGIDEPGAKIIDVFLCKLRKKLAAASGGKEYIKTIWGRGYVLHRPDAA